MTSPPAPRGLAEHILRLPFMICYAITMHIAYGVLLVGWGLPGGVAIIGGFGWAIDIFGNEGAGWFLIGVAGLAALGVAFERHIPRVTLTAILLPQYAVLLYALYEGAHAVIFGLEVRNTAGVTVDVPLLTIVSALHPIWWAAIWHGFAFLARALNTADEGGRREVYLEARLIEEIKRGDALAEALAATRSKA